MSNASVETGVENSPASVKELAESRTTPSPDAQLSATALSMLDTAERLFAQKGFDKVSLREIVSQSGQRNLSAASYHFGRREQLVGLLLARRIWFINQDRHQRLDALQAAGADHDLFSVVRASLMPLATVVRDQAWGANYVRVLAQANFSPSLHPKKVVDPVYLDGLVRMRNMLRACLPDLPERVFLQRMQLMNNDIVFALAVWINEYGLVTRANRSRYDALIDNTLEFLTAGMRAPVAP